MSSLTRIRGAPSPRDRSRHQVEIVDHDPAEAQKLAGLAAGRPDGLASHHYSAEELKAGGADYVIESLTEGLPL